MTERTCGLLDDLSGLHPGDHICWSYGSDEEHRRTLTAYMLEGLKRQERLVIFTHHYSPQKISGYLESAGVEVESLVASRQLVFLSAPDVYAPAGTFEPGPMLEQFELAVENALADGYPSLRAASETEWLLPAFSDPETLLQFEFEAERLVSRLKLTGLCGFDRRRCDPALLLRLEAIHPARSMTSFGQQSTFGISASPSGDIAVDGEIDLLGRDAWDTVLGIVSQDVSSLTLDMARVDFIDAAALRSLAGVAARLASEGGSVTLHSLHGSARRCLELLDLSRMPGLQLAGTESRN